MKTKIPVLVAMFATQIMNAALVEKDRAPAGNTAWLRDEKMILIEWHGLDPEKRDYHLSSIGIGQGPGDFENELKVRVRHGAITEVRPLAKLGDKRYSIRDLNEDGIADYIAIHHESNGEIALEAFMITGSRIRPVPDKFLIKTASGYEVQFPSLGDYITEENRKEN